MSHYFDYLPEDYDAGSAEGRAAAGGMLPPGHYYAKLEGAQPKEAKSGNVGEELTFTITSGPFAGTTVTDTLWRGDKVFTADRIIRFGSRLGLFQCDPKTGKSLTVNKLPVPVEGKTDFRDCLDAEVIIEVEHEADRENPSKHWVRVKPFGIFHLTDPEAKAKVGKPVEPKAEKKPAAAKKPEEPAKKKLDRGEL